MDWAKVIEAAGSWVEKNGFAAFVASVLILAIYKSIRWLMVHVVKPAAERIVEGHDRFINSSLASQEKLDICLERQGTCLEGQGRTLDELKEHSATHTQLLTMIADQTKPLLKIAPPTRRTK